MKQIEGKLLLESLKRVAPGTILRTGIEYILQGKTGGLVVVGDSDEVLKLVNGGFYIGCAFSPAKFYELSKMDGAIILSSDVKKILYANTHLFPDPEIETSETGTRHRTAERVAKQTRNLVISISQKRDVITLYIDDIKYMLEEPRVVLSKANQALQTLEKYKKGLDQLTFNLTIRELEDLVTLFDAVSVLQRSAIVQKTEKEVRKYIYELGTDGRLLKMQVEELMANVVDDSIKIIKDYAHAQKEESASRIKDEINELSADELLNLDKIASIIGYGVEGNLRECSVCSRGIRVVTEARRLPQSVLNNLIEKFGNLSNILAASVEDFTEVNGMGKVRAKSLYNKLKKFSEYYLYNEPYNFKGEVVQRLKL